MVHVRDGCKNVSISYSAPPVVGDKIKTYRHTRRFDSQSDAITDLILKGLKYEELLQKKRKRMSS